MPALRSEPAEIRLPILIGSSTINKGDNLKRIVDVDGVPTVVTQKRTEAEKKASRNDKKLFKMKKEARHSKTGGGEGESGVYRTCEPRVNDGDADVVRCYDRV